MSCKDSDSVVDWSTVELRITQSAGGAAMPAGVGGGQLARLALLTLLGDANVREAVDVVIARRDGWLVAQSVLRFLKPMNALEYTLRLLDSENDSSVVHGAAELIRYLVEEESMWVLGDLMSHSSSHVRDVAATAVLDLAHKDGIGDDEEFQSLLARMEGSSDSRVKESIAKIRLVLAGDFDALDPLAE